MRFHFWYKKYEELHETEFDCFNNIEAYMEAHEILRGFYATSTSDDFDKYYFKNSKDEVVGILSPLAEKTADNIPKKGLITFGEMLVANLKKKKNV